MNPGVTFESIESAHEFVRLFADVVIETKHDLEADLQREIKSGNPRHMEALQIVLYNLGTLELHLKKSRRVLNDLRSLRRLLLGERTRPVAATPSNSGGIRKTIAPSSRSSEVSRSDLKPKSTVSRDASLCAKLRRRALSINRAGEPWKTGTTDVLRWYVRDDFKKPPNTN